jgi:hypothetical protein
MARRLEDKVTLADVLAGHGETAHRVFVAQMTFVRTGRAGPAS